MLVPYGLQEPQTQRIKAKLFIIIIIGILSINQSINQSVNQSVNQSILLLLLH